MRGGGGGDDDMDGNGSGVLFLSFFVSFSFAAPFLHIYHSVKTHFHLLNLRM